MNLEKLPQSEFALYQTEDGRTRVTYRSKKPPHLTLYVDLLF